MSASNDNRNRLRNWVKTNPGLQPELREFFQILDRDLKSNDVWSTTTTTTTSSSTTSSSTTTTTTA